MKLHSIQTSIGSATLADLNDYPQISAASACEAINSPKEWGLIIWGRCNRVTFGMIVCNSSAEWIADYSPNDGTAIVIYSHREGVNIGDRADFDPSCVSVHCPSCGSVHCVSSSANWRCKICYRQWRKSPEQQQRGRSVKGRSVK